MERNIIHLFLIPFIRSRLRDIAISGFFALLPLYVLFIVIAKA